MPATRPRRIVRRAVMAAAVVVLLVVGYVVSYGAMEGSHGWWIPGKRPAVSLSARRWMHHTAFAPIHAGAMLGAPFCATVEHFGESCYFQGWGRPLSWKYLTEARHEEEVEDAPSR